MTSIFTTFAGLQKNTNLDRLLVKRADFGKKPHVYKKAKTILK